MSHQKVKVYFVNGEKCYPSKDRTMRDKATDWMKERDGDRELEITFTQLFLSNEFSVNSISRELTRWNYRKLFRSFKPNIFLVFFLTRLGFLFFPWDIFSGQKYIFMIFPWCVKLIERENFTEWDLRWYWTSFDQCEDSYMLGFRNTRKSFSVLWKVAQFLS